MDVSVSVLLLAAATMLAVGGYLAVNLPAAIRQPGGSALAKTLGAIMLLGGAAGLLTLASAIIAALVGAAPVAVWLATAFIVATGVVALSVLALVVLAVWRTAVVKRRPPGGT